MWEVSIYSMQGIEKGSQNEKSSHLQDCFKTYILLCCMVLFHIVDNAVASYPDLIFVLLDDQVVCLHFPAIVIQKQYIQKFLSNHCQPVRILELHISQVTILANVSKGFLHIFCPSDLHIRISFL